MKKQITSLTTAFLLAASVAVAGCSDDHNKNPMSGDTAPTMDIVETAMSAGNFTTLVAAVEAAGLVDALKAEGPLTVFAPTDDAFAALPEGTVESLLADPEALASILTYHVVAGKVTADQVVELSEAKTLNGASAKVTVTEDGKVMIDEATVVATDIEATNGVIHVIDAVILPEASSNARISTGNAVFAAASGMDAQASMASAQSGTARTPIYALANKSGFTTLATAIRAAGLQQTLTVDGPFTVFAPTDEAFAALPAGTLESLLADPEALTNILLYHVVSGEVKAADVVTLSEATMLNGEKVSISVGDGVMVNDANVSATDIMAKNGVVHVIDKVLIP